jgi:hypothetical protein
MLHPSLLTRQRPGTGQKLPVARCPARLSLIRTEAICSSAVSLFALVSF